MAITSPEPTPTPPQLTHAPECVALSLLDNALYTAGFALLAVNPRAADADFEPFNLDHRDLLAEAILTQADILQRAIHRYRRTTSTWPCTRADCECNQF